MQNLWNDDTSIDAAQHTIKRNAGRQPGSRPPTDATTLVVLRAWLLHDYIVPYCHSLAATRIFRRCFWIDGLGESRSTPSNLQDAGAAAQELSRQNRPILLQTLALQPGKSNRGRASATQDKKAKEQPEQAQETPFVLPKQNSHVNADWPTIAPALFASLDQAAAIFLLNPLANSPSATSPFFAHRDLAPLYTRTAPTELCLLLSHAQIESRLLPALRTPAGAAAFTALLRSDRWKAALAGSLIERPYDTITGHLRTAIQPHFLTAQHIAFPVCTGPAAIVDAPYTLVFATRRQDSLVCMNDAICGYRHRLEEASYQGLLNEDWFRTRHKAQLAREKQTLLEDILRIGRAQAPRRWPDLRQQLLLDRFGSYLLHDYDECIGELLEAGEVRCEWRQRGDPLQDEQPIPRNEDILYWGKRP